MNKGKVLTRGRCPSGARQGKQGMPFWVYIAFGLVALGLGIGLAVYFSRSGESSQAASSPGSAGPLRLAVVGQPAPGFSLKDYKGQPYTLNPGDGKNHLLVFYMGYF